jgi:hypothetical protein
MVCIQDI